MKKDKEKAKIFISYSYKDAEYVKTLIKTLRSILPNAVILDPGTQISQGEEIADRVSKMLRESDIVIAMLTQESADTPNILFELGIAVSLQKRVIPIAKQNTDLSLLPFNMKGRNIIVNTGPKSTAERLAKEMLAAE
jgi:nucleoside 2-deoxyribosyltransferase